MFVAFGGGRNPMKSRCKMTFVHRWGALRCVNGVTSYTLNEFRTVSRPEERSY
jgi:hypothetical protein